MTDIFQQDIFISVLADFAKDDSSGAAYDGLRTMLVKSLKEENITESMVEILISELKRETPFVPVKRKVRGASKDAVKRGLSVTIQAINLHNKNPDWPLYDKIIPELAEAYGVSEDSIKKDYSKFASKYREILNRQTQKRR